MSLPAAAQSAPEWTLVIHGGAGVLQRDKMTPEREAAARAGLDAALDAGSKVLAGGGSALDAVEAAIRVLEDDPNFNAGRGAVFTYEGTNELDASIMDGATRAAGAVAGVTRTRHPVSLARKVMEDSPHVMLAGKGADIFSAEKGLEQADPSWFATDERRQQLEKMKAKKTSWFDVDMKYGTVGAVAKDKAGHVAAATSTGGVTGKRWGRVGDSPIIGAGTYADDRGCAISATGSGEYFIREGVAHEICARVRFKGESLKTAADVVMGETKALGGSGGVIVTGPTGEMGWSFNTPGMYRGKASAGGKKVIAIYGDEE
ncbi:isoaspartyl peptidase/L-asparaginase [Sphingomonas sp.]|uniref:isoaspartyl peptidase/L-asparaginase family protein n=1 Tax=Sphingomonas sp. TaxID=28214 RepID=UPI001EB0CFDE|nr:isoaspartyl peptidase/L-asparaginase [Sphingomonas sp.]MBX3595707.1 isoaspartyl peptidase/L-asparaginase [Sphingomonas sp.]